MTTISNLIAQKVELFGGMNNNIFHDFNKDEHHCSSSYHSDWGYTASIGLDSIKVDWLTLRFTLQYDQYKGRLG